VIGAEAPLVGDLEAVARQGMESGELRTDIQADVLALTIAGLMDLALVQHWVSDGVRPTLEEIPSVVLTLLLGPVG
jgi:hypothetical protein